MAKLSPSNGSNSTNFFGLQSTYLSMVIASMIFNRESDKIKKLLFIENNLNYRILITLKMLNSKLYLHFLQYFK